ncbi:MAG: DUF4859 domain-containing protein [Bacteroidales bacterium]|nr:DUF4859 domain-containing protein [Bacteroidales bacterium]
MKKSVLILLLAVLSLSKAFAYSEIRAFNAATGEKGLYKPSQWQYDSVTGEYAYDGVSYNLSRSRESDNFVVYWSSEYGTTAPDALSSGDFYYVDIDYILQQAEVFYKLYSEDLAFVDPAKSTTMSKYKCMICLIHTDTWMAYGGGYDYVVPCLWINPATCKPIGHTVAHEVGHSFHYMCFSEANNHQDSYTVNTGFHLACGNGQAIWEQTAQWQAANAYPAYMFSQSYPLFGNNANYAFSHEWMRYQSYWFHYYLCDYYDDLTMVGQVWNQPMKGQSNGSASDFCMAYMALKGLTAEQFFERYHDYAMHCATFDFSAAKSYRAPYIGKFDYHAVQLGEAKYQVSYASAPQCSGFNVIELAVPTAGKEVTTHLTALTPGCALANGDPAVYNNGNANALVAAGVTEYNSVSNASARGFRVGYAFYKSDGTTEYANDGIVHCTGTGEVTESITATVPTGTRRMFLVVTPSLSTYICHRWDDKITNDDQWPYQFELEGTTAKSVTPDIAEPEFEMAIDGRSISDVTLTYNVVLPPTNGHDGTTVNFSGSGLNALCTAFQMDGDEIFNNVRVYSAGQQKGTIMNYPVRANGTLQNLGKTTNGDFGHWFNSTGTAISYGNGCVAFAEFTKSTKSAAVGQFPGANSNGTKRTIREALKYINDEGETAIAYLVFNITFETGATAHSYLADIDYEDPGIEPFPTDVDFLAKVMEVMLPVVPGTTATYAQTDDDGAAFKAALKNISLVNFGNSLFKGYYHPMSDLPSAGLYYYTLAAEPTFVESDGDTTPGVVTYYNASSVTDDSRFSDQYCHYYDGTGAIIDDAEAAKLVVAFDNKERTYHVMATADCPLGTYTLWFGIARKVSGRLYFAYYPMTIQVVETIPDGIDVALSTSAPFRAVYDLSGRRMRSAVLPKGIYVIDGKKVLVR